MKTLRYIFVLGMYSAGTLAAWNFKGFDPSPEHITHALLCFILAELVSRNDNS